MADTTTDPLSKIIAGRPLSEYVGKTVSEIQQMPGVKPADVKRIREALATDDERPAPTPSPSLQALDADRDNAIERLQANEESTRERLAAAAARMDADRANKRGDALRAYAELLRDELPGERFDELEAITETLGLTTADVMADLQAFRLRQRYAFDYFGPAHPTASKLHADAIAKYEQLVSESRRMLGAAKVGPGGESLNVQIIAAEREKTVAGDTARAAQEKYNLAKRKLAALRAIAPRIFGDALNVPAFTGELKRPPNADRAYLEGRLSAGHSVVDAFGRYFSHEKDLPPQIDFDLRLIETESGCAAILGGFSDRPPEQVPLSSTLGFNFAKTSNPY